MKVYSFGDVNVPADAIYYRAEAYASALIKSYSRPLIRSR